MSEHAVRRARALTAFAGGVAVLPSSRTVMRNGDSEYGFRQNSDFQYLVGLHEPDCVLVLAPEHPVHRSVLFLRERDPAAEQWTGYRLGVERAGATLGIDAAFPIGELDRRLPEWLAGASALHYELGIDETMDRRVQAALESARSRTRRAGHAPDRIVSPGAVLHRMRLVKSDEELATLRRAAQITRNGHLAAMRATQPGRYEYEIEAIIEYEYLRSGAQSTAYESIVAGGDNATILHYSTNRDRLTDGTLLLVDSGCEVDCYASDVTRTWPVNGRFTAEQRAVYDIVLAAIEAGIDRVRPGAPQRAFHEAALRVLTAGLIDLGLLSGSVDENVERELYRPYYMHGTGHWIGLDVHDVGAYRDGNDRPIALEAGMVTTVEPGLYFRRDLDCDERFKGIGVRLEDDILVTPNGNENLTAAIPKRADEIEALVGNDACASVS